MLPEAECWVLIASMAPLTMACLSYEPARRAQRDEVVTKEIPDADRWADHRLAISEIRFRLEHRRRLQDKRPPRGKLNSALLSMPTHHLHVSNELAQRLANFPVAADGDAPMKNQLFQLRDTVQSTVLVVLGHARRQHQNWFDYSDAAIRNLLAKKNRPRKAYVCRPAGDNKTAVYLSRRLVQQWLCETQDDWTVCKAEEIQGYANRDEWKGSPRSRLSTASLLNAGGSTLCTE
ncbi:hypothetical protein SprV_0301140000 [Sparganum proliferum]